MRFLKIIILIIIFIFCIINVHAQKKSTEILCSKDSLAISSIKYLWKEDDCANNGIRKRVGFFILENDTVFIGKAQKEIKDIFGEPNGKSGYWDHQNTKMKNATVYYYTAEGHLCTGGDPVTVFEIRFVFIDGILVELSGVYE